MATPIRVVVRGPVEEDLADGDGDGDERRSELFKKIVVALDGSDGSRAAVPIATELAERDGAKLLIVHVEERVVGKGGGPVNLAEDDIQAGIRAEAQKLQDQGCDVEVQKGRVALGGPAHVIEEVAAEAGADLIVVGTRGHAPVAGLLLGSVTQRLLHVATRPVLVVPSRGS
jgi:nucleotide-binding universal stress UspA family protein